MNTTHMIIPSRNRGCAMRSECNPSVIATTIRTLTLVDAVTFLIAAVLHTGTHIPLGFAVLAEPHIVPAIIVEGTAGVLLATAAYGLFAHKPWGWTAAVTAHVFSILGVITGMVALAMGRGPRTESNDIYHRVILVVLVTGLFFLTRRGVRDALRRKEN
jgi:hypothetical protein